MGREYYQEVIRIYNDPVLQKQAVSRANGFCEYCKRPLKGKNTFKYIAGDLILVCKFCKAKKLHPGSDKKLCPDMWNPDGTLKVLF